LTLNDELQMIEIMRQYRISGCKREEPIVRIRTTFKITALTCGMLLSAGLAANAAPGTITAKITDTAAIMPGANCGGTYSGICPSDPTASSTCNCYIYTGSIKGSNFGGMSTATGVEIDLTEDFGINTTQLATGTPPRGCAPVFADVIITGAKNGNNQNWALLGSVCDAIGAAKTSLSGGFTIDVSSPNKPQFGVIQTGSTAGIASDGSTGTAALPINMTIKFQGQ
jgi:hypothetical protein